MDRADRWEEYQQRCERVGNVLCAAPPPPIDDAAMAALVQQAFDQMDQVIGPDGQILPEALNMADFRRRFVMRSFNDVIQWRLSGEKAPAYTGTVQEIEVRNRRLLTIIRASSRRWHLSVKRWDRNRRGEAIAEARQWIGRRLRRVDIAGGVIGTAAALAWLLYTGRPAGLMPRGGSVASAAAVGYNGLRRVWASKLHEAMGSDRLMRALHLEMVIRQHLFRMDCAEVAEVFQIGDEVRWSADGEEDHRCAIARAPILNVAQLACGHLFEAPSITLWFHQLEQRGQAQPCPLCRDERGLAGITTNPALVEELTELWHQRALQHLEAEQVHRYEEPELAIHFTPIAEEIHRGLDDDGIDRLTDRIVAELNHAYSHRVWERNMTDRWNNAVQCFEGWRFYDVTLRIFVAAVAYLRGPTAVQRADTVANASQYVRHISQGVIRNFVEQELVELYPLRDHHRQATIVDSLFPMQRDGRWLRNPIVVMKTDGTCSVWERESVVGRPVEELIHFNVEETAAYHAPGLKLGQLYLEADMLNQIGERLPQRIGEIQQRWTEGHDDGGLLLSDMVAQGIRERQAEAEGVVRRHDLRIDEWADDGHDWADRMRQLLDNIRGY